MHIGSIRVVLLLCWSALVCSSSPTIPSSQQQQQRPLLTHAHNNAAISSNLFLELEELARVVDIAYCVGGSGIQKPFQCVSRCADLPHLELVKTWNTGVLLSDSCGYIALDHRSSAPRILVAFRGTYSIANTIIDLSTSKHSYDAYPGADRNNSATASSGAKCEQCSVHSGFLKSWQHTRDAIMSDIETARAAYPTYRLSLVGHSLGGAVALLAALEFHARGWNPQITTFGEPRVGNAAFVQYVDAQLVDSQNSSSHNSYRRVTHLNDPVPLLPVTEWGYLPHAGEIYINKAALPPAADNVVFCTGDQDAKCSATADATLLDASTANIPPYAKDQVDAQDEAFEATTALWDFPARLKLWELFFAHRDYFWRLGVCISGGDPWDWQGKYPQPTAAV